VLSILNEIYLVAKLIDMVGYDGGCARSGCIWI